MSIPALQGEGLQGVERHSLIAFAAIEEDASLRSVRGSGKLGDERKVKGFIQSSSAYRHFTPAGTPGLPSTHILSAHGTPKPVDLRQERYRRSAIALQHHVLLP
eukprot:6300356-Amphidinium_carterae.2